MEPLFWHLILISPPIHYSIAGDIADALLRWMYDALIGGFETVIGDVVDIGTEVFEHPQNYPYVQVTIEFFQKLAWVFLALGLVLAAMEAAIAYYNGRGDFGNVALNVIKSYAVCFFLTTFAIRVYKFVLLDINPGWLEVVMHTGTNPPEAVDTHGILVLFTAILDGLELIGYGLHGIIMLLVILYLLIKIYFMIFKRTALFIALLGIGSLHMIEIPRGIWDGFTGWVKQVAGICFITVIQTTLLGIAARLFVDGHPLLGIGMMAACEDVPRIADRYGVDTSMNSGAAAAFGGAAHVIDHAVTLFQ